MIELIIGPMFSAKSTYLIQKLERGILANKKVCFCRHPKDIRKFISRTSLNNKYKFDIITIDNWKILDKVFKKYDIIAIDELQFFSISDIKKIIENSIISNKNIYIASLNASSEQSMFVNTTLLLPHANNIIYLKSVCTICGSDEAIYTICKKDKKTEIMIGDKEYITICSNCYRKKEYEKCNMH